MNAGGLSAVVTELILKNNNTLNTYTAQKVRTAFHLVLTASIQANKAGIMARKIKLLTRKSKSRLIQIKIIRFAVNLCF
jgi:hypothetical protein